MSNGDEDQTWIGRAVRRRPRYEGDERRGSTPVTLSSLLPWAAIIGAALSGAMGYATLTTTVEGLDGDLAEIKEWNKSISARLRELETK